MLYKYADINDNFTINNLINNQLGFNRIENFNDPFDTTPATYINKENMINYISSVPTIPNDVKKTIFHSSEKELKNIFLETIRKPIYTANKGITCFSETNNNILMWSHYSNKHKGICLGFDINEENLNDFIDKDKNITNNIFNSKSVYKLFAIKYSNNRPILNLFNINSIEESKQIRNMLISKSNIWKYEKEHRIIMYNGENTSFPTGIYYNRKYLKEIILGANLSINDFFKLYNVIKSFDINIKICIPNKEIYKLDLYSIDNNTMKILYENLTFLKLLSLSNNEFNLSILNLNKTFDEEIIFNLHQILNNIPLNILNKIFDKIPLSNIISFYPIIYKESIQNFNIANINSLLSFISSIASYSKYL